MLSRLFIILSLLVCMILLLSGSTVEPALIKTAAVFFSLVGGLILCRMLIPVIREEQVQAVPQEQESSTSKNAA